MWFLFVDIDENFNMIFFRFIMIGGTILSKTYLYSLFRSIRNGRQDEGSDNLTRDPEPRGHKYSD